MLVHKIKITTKEHTHMLDILKFMQKNSVSATMASGCPNNYYYDLRTFLTLELTLLLYIINLKLDLKGNFVKN